jgi:NhaP-type Na+/H+ or K+/H+ antiporter
LVSIVLLATFIARITSVCIPLLLMYAIKFGKLGISFKQILMIIFGGSIRGAIAFGLSLQIDSPHHEILKTTTLLVVLVTTIALGGTMAMFTDCIDLKGEGGHLDSSPDHLTFKRSQSDKPKIVEMSGESGSIGYIMRNDGDDNKKEKTCWRRFDDNYLKRLFGGRGA